MPGPYSADLYISLCGLWVAEISEEAMWLHVGSPFSMSHCPCFSTALLSVPTLRASTTRVTENKDAVVMTCSTNAPAIQWLFNGTNLQLTERVTLSPDHRNLTIDPVQREDAGDYQCKGFNPVSSGKSASLVLDVKFEWFSFPPLCY